ncbi:MAG: hypothetical protein HQL44_11915 [Alphaproteobacteria bacterium]|nr:hypothetical protein [Alphaproteobacteria bacterium]
MKTTAPTLPTVDDQETELLRAAIERARESVKRGRVVSHERVRDWLKALSEGREVPCPAPSSNKAH